MRKVTSNILGKQFSNLEVIMFGKKGGERSDKALALLAC